MFKFFVQSHGNSSQHNRTIKTITSYRNKTFLLPRYFKKALIVFKTYFYDLSTHQKIANLTKSAV